MEFKLSEREKNAYHEFGTKHKGCRINKDTHMSKFGTIGGGLRISFEPTGLGSIVTVKCLGCNEEEDITDIDMW